MKKILILCLCSLFLFGCQSKGKSKSYKELMAEKEYTIVDVRTKEEYETSHIKGAIHIPYDEINEKTNLEKDKIIFVYCKSGNRSGKAYQTLKQLGYEVYDLGAFSTIDLEKE